MEAFVEPLETVEISPSPNLIETLGYSGYSLEAAIADIVDNSITASATRIEIKFDFDYERSTVKIIDNGYGMNKQDLIDAMTIAKKSIHEHRSKDDLGRFGLGLKSASASNAKVFTVTSKRKDLDTFEIMLDIDKMIKSAKWSADFIVPVEEIKVSGTIVKWEKLTFLKVEKDIMKDHFYMLLEKVDEHLGKVFYEFIKDGKIKIIINGNLTKPKDPFFRNHVKTRSLGIIPIPYKKHIVDVEPFILPVYEDLSSKDKIELMGRGLEDQQGFYIYRNNRLIVDGGWLGLKGFKIDNKANYARIRVSIPKELDIDFNINFAKNIAVVPPMLTGKFAAIAKRSRKESGDNFNYKLNPNPKKKKTGDEINVWSLGKNKSGYFLEINRDHPIISGLTKFMEKKDISKLFSLIAATIPIDEIQNTGSYTTKDLDKHDFEVILMEEYNKMKMLGMESPEILKKLAREQPFSSNLGLMSEILLKKGKI